MRTFAVVVAAGCALAAGYLVAAVPGVLLIAAALAGLGLVALRSGLPGAVPPRPRPAKPGDLGEPGDFASYRKIANALSWAGVSARHYDSVTRPLLARLLAAGLAERYGPGHDPALARAFMGERLWPLVDPGRPGSRDSFAPGPDPAVLHEIADRLEDLWRRR
ncbi:hypothetical protein [Actinomadura verrucosospora]|uniref:hypothetical protein n=1 Tax=Actinomadura verrucosospora TaxID=46165 RepID=UPI0015652DCB|nr:hypothetical protein [Actinomadura verrucosospora]